MFCDSAVIKLQIALFFLLFSSVIQADTLVILERSGTLTFTHSLSQELQKKQLPEHVHVGYVDTIYSTLKPDTKTTSIELYKSAILSSAGIDEFTTIDKVISQGSASARFLEDHPELFSQAERFFTHIAWQPTTGTLIPSDAPSLRITLLGDVRNTKHHCVVYATSKNASCNLSIGHTVNSRTQE